MLDIPIIHVNSADPESCIKAIDFAIDYRTVHKKDVVINLVAYRKYGHNEADDPTITQPQMYKEIKSCSSLDLYQSTYVKAFPDEQIYVENLRASVKEKLVSGACLLDDLITNSISEQRSLLWKKHHASYDGNDISDSTMSVSKIQTLRCTFANTLEGFTLHRAVRSLLNQREKMAKGEVK